MGPVAATKPQSDLREPRKPPPALLDLMRGVRRPLILTHVVPDADCLGAALGLAVTLIGRGVQADVGVPGGTSKRLRFMLELSRDVRIVTHNDDGYDATLVLDTASEKRINLDPKPVAAAGRPIVNIDHHITNPDYGTLNWVDPHAASTCEMVARLLRELEWPPPAAAASLLYAGIHGDTAGFSLPNTSADALHVAAELVRAGADVTHIGEQLCRSQARHDFELLRRVYEHTTLVSDGRIAYSFLTHADIVAAQCSADDIDDQVSIPRALKGVRIAILFSEGEPGVVRVNLRGEGRTHVISIAEAFGGGGHVQSAGVRVRNKPIEQVIRDVLAAAEAHLAQEASAASAL